MVRKSVTIVDKAVGEQQLKKLFKQIAGKGAGSGVKIGILADSGVHKAADGATVAQVALWNEFGTKTIPERPFMRTSGEQLMPILSVYSERLIDAMLLGKITLDNALDRVGLLAQAHIKKVIIDWSTPPNAPRTILQKARKTGRAKIAGGDASLAAYDNPLIDTGQMLGSVTYEKVYR